MSSTLVGGLEHGHELVRVHDRLLCFDHLRLQRLDALSQLRTRRTRRRPVHAVVLRGHLFGYRQRCVHHFTSDAP